MAVSLDRAHKLNQEAQESVSSFWFLFGWWVFSHAVTPNEIKLGTFSLLSSFS